MSARPRCLVRFAPSGRSVEVPAGTSLFQAARRVGLGIGHACEAEGICGACGLRVLHGAQNLSPEGPAETQVKAANRVPQEQRLSCLARVRGPVQVRADYW